MAGQRLQPVDIATGVISGTLAALFFTLAVVVALPDDEPTAPVLDSAVTSTQR
ncbi:hypothetical protein [Nocardioides rubriscoriae]|uniref:hypothetical protein n=1 Tax=Nocardioides rubriscoriae TaxID=642762 RepID=UPI0014787806|nr:hypothetical protein [Nocardioides rubriscoriae]